MRRVQDAAATLPEDDVTELDIRTDDRVAALRVAVGELLAGYAEVARLAPLLPEDLRDSVLVPLRRAADSAATALAQS